MYNKLLHRIESNPKVMLGKPVIKNTRVTVEVILKKLSQEISFDEILADYPGITHRIFKLLLLMRPAH